MNCDIIHLREESFDKDVLQSEGLLLVDFWASWCTPCNQMDPILRDIAHEFSQKLTVAKLNIDESPSLAKKYGIRSIPTLLLFRDGEVLDNKVGIFSRGELREFINSID